MSYLADNSDVLFKFVYWRSAVDVQPAAEQLLRLTSRLIIAVNSQIT